AAADEVVEVDLPALHEQDARGGRADVLSEQRDHATDIEEVLPVVQLPVRQQVAPEHGGKMGLRAGELSGEELVPCLFGGERREDVAPVVVLALQLTALAQDADDRRG